MLRALGDLLRGGKAAAQAESGSLADAHFSSGTAKRNAGRLAEAFADFSRAAELKPHDPHCLLQAAEVAYLVGKPQLALEYCGRLRSVAPELGVTESGSTGSAVNSSRSTTPSSRTTCPGS
jgi:tetratricopeptide (TPR) repeat protein